MSVTRPLHGHRSYCFLAMNVSVEAQGRVLYCRSVAVQPVPALPAARSFLRGRARVMSRPEVLGGEEVFAGTRISVRFVGERAKSGESLDVLLEDYPALDANDVEFARTYVELGRPPGRPRKKLRFVQADG
jgi:uncharacterized protein (DUF433 family)